MEMQSQSQQQPPSCPWTYIPTTPGPIWFNLLVHAWSVTNPTIPEMKKKHKSLRKASTSKQSLVSARNLTLPSCRRRLGAWNRSRESCLLPAPPIFRRKPWKLVKSWEGYWSEEINCKNFRYKQVKKSSVCDPHSGRILMASSRQRSLSRHVG